MSIFRDLWERFTRPRRWTATRINPAGQRFTTQDAYQRAADEMTRSYMFGIDRALTGGDEAAIVGGYVGTAEVALEILQGSTRYSPSYVGAAERELRQRMSGRDYLRLYFGNFRPITDGVNSTVPLRWIRLYRVHANRSPKFVEPTSGQEPMIATPTADVMLGGSKAQFERCRVCEVSLYQRDFWHVLLHSLLQHRVCIDCGVKINRLMHFPDEISRMLKYKSKADIARQVAAEAARQADLMREALDAANL